MNNKNNIKKMFFVAIMTISYSPAKAFFWPDSEPPPKKVAFDFKQCDFFLRILQYRLALNTAIFLSEMPETDEKKIIRLQHSQNLEYVGENL